MALCPEVYCLRSPTSWLSIYTLVITADGWVFEEAGGVATPDLDGETMVMRVAYGSLLRLRNDDTVTHAVGIGPFHASIAPDELLLLHNSVVPGADADPADLWDAPLGKHVVTDDADLELDLRVDIFLNAAVSINGECGEGCCRTSIALTGFLRYQGFQGFPHDGTNPLPASPLYPQYLKFERTIEYYARDIEYGEPENPGDPYPFVTINGGKMTETHQIKDRIQLTTRRTEFTFEGDYCQVGSQIEGNVDWLTPADPNPFYKMYSGDWIYDSAIERHRYLAWWKDDGAGDPPAPVNKGAAGIIRERFLDGYTWSMFIADFNRLFPNHPNCPWELVPFPFTEYSAQWCIYDSFNALEVLKDGVFCPLCDVPGEGEVAAINNYDCADAYLCKNDTRHGCDETPSYESYPPDPVADVPPFCADTPPDGQPISRCIGGDIIAEVSGVMWREGFNDASGEHDPSGDNLCAEAAMNAMEDFEVDYLISAPLHIPAYVMYEATDRYIDVTKRIVKNFWSLGYKRMILEGVDEVITSCTERANGVHPCAWIDDPSVSDAPLDADAPLQTQWTAVETWPGTIEPGEIKIRTVSTVCPDPLSPCP